MWYILNKNTSVFNMSLLTNVVSLTYCGLWSPSELSMPFTLPRPSLALEIGPWLYTRNSSSSFTRCRFYVMCLYFTPRIGPKAPFLGQSLTEFSFVFYCLYCSEGLQYHFYYQFCKELIQAIIFTICNFLNFYYI